MSYTKTNWQDLPDQTTPVNATNLNKIENQLEFLTNALYPIGSIYMSVNSTNPSIYFGGTWVAWGSGRVPVGVNANDTDFDTVEETGGTKTVTLTSAQSGVPAHSHGLNNHTHSIPQLSGTAAAKTVGMRWSQNYTSSGDGYCTFAGNSVFANQNSSSGGGGTLTISNSSHNHSVTTNASTTGQATGSTANNTATDASSAHTNLQPYITCYMWKRTA